MVLTTIASGNGTLQLPEYVTIKTGRYSSIPENIEVTTRKGNTFSEPIFSPWVPMHGTKIFYRKHDANKFSTIHDNSFVTFMATGAWKVRVEKPPGE